MFPTKASEPDGFPVHFFQKHWNLCGEELTQIVIRLLKGRIQWRELTVRSLPLFRRYQTLLLSLNFDLLDCATWHLKLHPKYLLIGWKDTSGVSVWRATHFCSWRLITDNVITAYECVHLWNFGRGRRIRIVPSNFICASLMIESSGFILKPLWRSWVSPRGLLIQSWVGEVGLFFCVVQWVKNWTV
jgi:hypothetical protein